MNRATKSSVLTVGLVVVLLWPVAHFFLVERYDVSAWKFGGWAMYSRLGPQAHVKLGVTRDGVTEELDWSSMPLRIRKAATTFQWRTRQYGLLARSDTLAAAMLKGFPTAQIVTIQRDSPFLDPTVDRVLVRRTTFSYARDGALSVAHIIVRNGADSDRAVE